MLDPREERIVDLKGCARCHGEHVGLVFMPFRYAMELDHEAALTHWVSCPTNGEPILMRVVEE